MLRTACTARALIALLFASLLSSVAAAAPVRFVVNDAMVKGQVVPDVHITIASSGGDVVSTGTTDASGRLEVDIPSGSWSVSYAKHGYVPIPNSPTPIPDGGTTITTALTLMMESAGTTESRRVQIVLTWGSGWSSVRDADAHLVCPCDDDEVQFSHMRHERADHQVVLDVDDMAWGGPETITLTDPPPGRYRYFVQSFSGPPATLGSSAAVVRVLFGDEVAAEFPVPADVDGERWMPFQALIVDEQLQPTIEPFTAAQRDAGEHSSGHATMGCDSFCCSGFGTLLLLGLVGGVWSRWRISR